MQPPPMVEAVGRHAELATIRDALADLRTVLLTGAAGIGKTTLLEAVTDELAAGGVETWKLRSVEHDQRPLAPLRPFVESVAVPNRPISVNRPSSLGSARQDQPDLAAAESVLDELARRTRPLCIALDDAQWADPTTLAVMRLTTARRESLDVRVIVARRPHPSPLQLDRLIQQAVRMGAIELVIERLRPADVDELVAQVTRVPVTDAARAVLAGADGNPFFTLQLLSVMRTSDGELDESRARSLHGLRDAVLYSLGTLTRETIGFVQLAAVVGAVVDLDLVAQLKNTSVVSLMTTIRECVAAGVFIEVDGDLRFAHDLVRESVYDDLPVAIRHSMHEDIAGRLMSAGASPERYGRHLVLASRPGDRRAAAGLRSVGRELVESHPAVARAIFERGFEIDEYHDDRDTLDLAHSMAWSGSLGEAGSLCRDALDRGVADPVMAALFEAMVMLARPDLPTSAASRAERFEQLAATPGIPEVEAAYLLNDAAWSHLWSASLGRAGIVALRALDLYPDAPGSAMCEGVLAWVDAYTGNVPGALDHASRLLRHADRVSGGLLPTVADFFAGMALLDADQLDEASNLFARGRERVAASGSWMLPLLFQGAGAARLLAGRWVEAQAEAEAGLEVAADFDGVDAEVRARATLAWIEIGRGRSDRARDHLDAGEHALASGAPGIGSSTLRYVRGLFSVRHGDDRSAVDLWGNAWDLNVALGVVNSLRLFAPDLVAAAIRIGEIERARSVVASLHQLVESGRSQFTVVHDWCAGLLEDDVAPLESAYAGLASSPRRFDRAAVGVEIAARIAESDPARATALFESAIELWHAERAHALAADARARAASAGVAVGVPAADNRVVHPVEAAVIGLVGAGVGDRALAERMGVPARTIEAHVRILCEELGVSDRSALAGHRVDG